MTIFAAQGSGAKLDDLESSVKNWLELRKQQALLEKNWKEEKKILTAELDRLEHEIDLLTSGGNDIDAKIESLEKAVHQLEILRVADGKVLKEKQAVVAGYEKGIKSLVSYIPEFIKKKSEPAFSVGYVDLAKKTSALLAFASELEEASKKWHLVDEIVVVGNKKYSLRVLYCGLSVAYGISKDNSIAALMTVRDKERMWTLSPQSAEQIRNAFKFFDQGGGDEIPVLPFKMEVPK